MGKLEIRVTQHILDNLICMQLFDMTLIEFIATAKQRAGKHWGTLWDDDMESARDELSSLSLKTLSNAESTLANALRSGAVMAGQLTSYTAITVAANTIKNMKVPKDKIWYDPKVDGIEGKQAQPDSEE